MRLSVYDILAYNYCPLLQRDQKSSKFLKTPTLFEATLRETIVLAEKIAIDLESPISLKKLNRAWDKIWWPRAAEYGLSPKQAQNESIKAERQFLDYLKYDINDPYHPTVGADLEAQRLINGVVVSAHIDIAKVSLEEGGHLILIDMERQGLKQSLIMKDPAILAKAFLFSSGEEKTITFANLDLTSPFGFTTAIFRQEDLRLTEKMLQYTTEGVKKEVYFARPWICEQCKEC